MTPARYQGSETLGLGPTREAPLRGMESAKQWILKNGYLGRGGPGVVVSRSIYSLGREREIEIMLVSGRLEQRT